MVLSEDGKQLQIGERFETGEETGREIKDVVEGAIKSTIQSINNQDTGDVIGTSSQMAKTEDQNLNAEGDNTLKDDRILDHYVEAISHQQASIKEIPQTLKEEKRGAQKIEEEKLDKPLNVISEEIETAASRKYDEFQNPEDSLEEKRKDDKLTAAYDTSGDEISGQKNLPFNGSNEKIESAEAKIPNNNARVINVMHSVVGELGQGEGKRIHDVLESEPEEHIQKSNGTSTDEKNEVANVSEAYKTTERTILEYSSTEGMVRMEMIAKTSENTADLETVSGLVSEENLVVKEAEVIVPEVSKEEAIDTETHKVPTSHDTEEGLLEDDNTKVYSTVHTGEKIVKQSFQVESPDKAESKSSGEDERNNTTVEEHQLSKLVHDGHGIQAISRKQIAEANVVFVNPKPIEEEITKNHQDNENETKNSREEDGCLKSIKEGNVDDLSQESIGGGPTQNYDDKKETTNTKGEIASVRARESTAPGTIHNTESLENIPSASQQEEGLQGDSEYLAPIEASAKDRDENASSGQVAEDNNNSNRPAETIENSAKVTPQGEEDLQQGLQINESPENILGASLVKQKGLQGEVENQYSTESSTEKRDEETSSIKVAGDNDKNTAETTEIGARVIEGEEETDHVLKNDEPGETDREVESPAEELDTAKQGNGLHGDDDNPVPPGTSINKRDELTSSVEMFGDNHENNRLAEATENNAKTTPEGDKDSEPPLQRDKTEESIALETNHGVEGTTNIPNIALVKQEEGLQEEYEKIAPSEAEIERRYQDTCYLKVVEDKDVNNMLAEATENSAKATPEGQEDSDHTLQKNETRESIAPETNHGVEKPKKILDSALVKQEEVLQGEVENQYSTESSIENRDKETSSIKVAEDKDDNNRPVETTENQASVIRQGEGERDHVLQNDEPEETDREVESPRKVLDTVKQGNGLQGDDDKLVTPETSINKRDELTFSVEMFGDYQENNRLAEASENSAKTAPEGEEDLEPPLERDETGKSIPLETNHGVEVPKNILDPALMKQQEGLQAECEKLASTEAEIEKKDGNTSYVKETEDNYANNKLIEATSNSTKTTPEGEDDSEKSIALKTAHGVEISRNIPDLAWVKQDGLQAECEKIALPEAEIETRHDSLAEATDNSENATPEGQEDSELALYKHPTRESTALETYHVDESPKNIPDSILVKQEEVLQGKVENKYSTESSIENRDEETSSIEVAKGNAENNRPAETTENHARVVQQGEEETDHVLQNDESGETDCEVESPGEILNTVKQENGLQGDDENLVPENSINKKDYLTSLVEVFKDKNENNGQAEAAESSAKTIPEEDSGHAFQRDETEEIIAHETNHGVEGPKNIPDHALVKQEEGLQAECEKLASTEAEIEKKEGVISYFKVPEDNNANNKLAEATERNTKIPSEFGEYSNKVLLTDEPGQTIRGQINHNVEGPENNLDSLLVKQRESIHGEGDNVDQTKTSIKVAKAEEYIRLVETKENSIMVILKGKEDSEHVLQKDDTKQKPIPERNQDVEKPEEDLDDKSLVNQEEDFQVQGENLAPTESSMENKDEGVPQIKIAGQKAENNMQDEDRENSPKGTHKLEDSEDCLSKDARGEIIGCEAEHEIESLEKIDNSILVSQDEFLQGEGHNLISKEASVERGEGETSYMKMAEVDNNDRLVEAADISVKVTAKGEVDLKQVLQKDQTGEQPEQLLDVISADKEAEYVPEKMDKTTSIKEEGLIQNHEETLEVEKKEAKTVDDEKEKEAAIEKVHERLQEVDGSEGINEQAKHGESGLKEIPKVSAEDDILDEVEDCGKKSSDYLEETDSSKQTETLTAAIQEPTKETEASGTTAPEEEKIQDEVSLGPVNVSTTEAEEIEETIKEKIKVDVDNFLGENDNTNVVPTEPLIQEAQMDDKDFKETSLDERVENITVQPSPQAEEVGSKKLQIEEADGTEVIKELAIHGQSELKEIPKVSAEDDILEKVEECGTKSSDYLEETDYIEQTETLRGDIQEPIRETEAFDTKAQEEENIQDEASHKPVDVLTTEAEDAEEKIKDNIRLQADNFVDQNDNATLVPVESLIRESHMDDKDFKETSSDESVETITFQPCPQAEEVGSKKLQIEEFDGTEGSKERAIHGQSELKEIPKISAEDDIFEKVEECGTKSSDYLEETDYSKQTETLTADIQEPKMETGASDTKAQEEENIQDEAHHKHVDVSTREAEDSEEKIKENMEAEANNFLDQNVKATAVPAESLIREAHMDVKAVNETRADESVETITVQPCPQVEEVGSKKIQIEEFDGTEGIKKQAIHGQSELKEIPKVSAEDDILEKVKECGTKSSDYLEEKDYSEQTETLRAYIQEPKRETEASDTKAQEDENKQDEARHKPVDVLMREAEDAEEKIKENMEVEADKFLDQNDNATVVPGESLMREAHMDDKAVDETRVDESVESIKNQPCPQAEEVGSKKLQNEEVDGSEGIKEQAMHGESELKEIPKVSAEDDILEKVEDCGKKSSDYLEETDSSKQTETLTAAIQEPTKETEASGTTAPEEEKIQDEVSLGPVNVSTTEAEEIEETIKEKIKVDVDNFLGENDNTNVVPTEPLIQEAQMDDKDFKETSLDERVENITVQPCPQAEEVGSKKLQIEEVDGTEGIKEPAIHGQSELKEIPKISAEDDIFKKVEECGTKSSDYLEETDYSKQTETLTADIQEPKMETGASDTKAQEEENIQDEAHHKHVDVSTREAEDAEEKIKDNIRLQADNFVDQNDNATLVPVESLIRESHMDDKDFKETSSDESVETITFQPCPQAEEVGSKKLQIEEFDGTEGIKEPAIHGQSELKEIPKISAEDDIFEKVEECGTKSSDYLKETDYSKQTEILTADIQEPKMETGTSDTKAQEEENIQDEAHHKHVDVSTREAEDAEEKIKENMEAEANNFLDQNVKATAVPAESFIREAHMDDKAVNETRADESVETITVQPCPQAEEVGSKKIQIEEFDGTEGIKKQAIHGQSELKEIPKVSAEDDILEKVKECGTKSSDYLEEKDYSEQTETLRAYIQEPKRETEASDTKAQEDENKQDEAHHKPVDVLTREAEDAEEEIKENMEVEADKFLDQNDNATVVPGESLMREAHMDDKAVDETRADESVESIKNQPCPQAEEVGSKKLQTEEVDGIEGIKEQAMHGESELKEIPKVSAEDDILEKVEDCGKKCSDYLEETDSSKQTETLTAAIQEPTKETEASGTTAPEEEKIQDEVSLVPVDVSTTEAEETEETIKEKIKVDVDNFLGENDNTNVVPTEPLIREAQMDDKDFKETSLDERVETITVQPCPQAEEVGSKKLQIEEVDGTEGIKELATHGQSELKEIHKVSAEDDILEKVEDCGTKPSDNLEETDSSEQTETLTAAIQEPTRETEESGTKAPEEEKIHDELSLKPVDVLTTEAEQTEETINEKIKVEVDNFLDENDNIIVVPTESLITEAQKDDKAFKETSSDESVETITIQPCPQAEEIGSKKLQIEEVDGTEGIKELAIHGQSELKEISKVSAEDDLLEKVEDCGTKSSDYLEETDYIEQTKTTRGDIQEPIRETEAFDTKAQEEENIQDEIGHKPVDVLTRESEDAEEKIKKHIEVQADNFVDQNDNAAVVPAESLIRESHMDDKDVKETSSEESVETITDQPCPQGEEVGSKKFRIEEVDGNEGIKEQAIHGESELKEIHKVSAEDDIIEKVEDCGPKPSDYVEGRDPSEQTETVTADIQEPIMETGASATKALEEEKTQDEVSLNPVDVLMTDAEEEEEKIEENIRVEVFNFLDGNENATVVPAESIMREAHMDDKDCSSNESIETITIQPCLQAEEVGSEKLQIEEVDRSEAIKEQAIHGESELKEIHKLSAEDDKYKKVEDCGTNSSYYLEATDPSEQTETVTADIQEPILETGASGTKALEEEKTQDEVSLNPVDVLMTEAEDAEEKIEENIRVEVDNFLDGNENATVLPAESIIREAHMDDKESSSNESLETITIQPFLQAEEVGSEKLPIGEFDRSEAIKEQAIHGESEFKEIHILSAEDDKHKKVEDCGKNSSYYLEAKDPSEQTETVKADIQEPMMETEASGTKALEEEKTQDDKAFKESSSNEILETVTIQHCPQAEEVGSEKLRTEEVDGSEAIKEQAIHRGSEFKEIHEASAEDYTLEKVENSKSSDYLEAADPSEQTETVKADIQEPIMEIEASGTKALEEEKTRDDKGFKESSSNESLETVTIQHCPQAEEVGSEKLRIEEVDGSEAIKEQAVHGNSEFKEIHEVSAEDDILKKVENSGTNSSYYLEAADPSEETETNKADIQEPIMETEASGTKALEEEKTQDEVSLKPVDVSTTEAEDAEKEIKEKIKVEVDHFPDGNDNATVVTAESIIQEACTDDKAYKESSSNESLETITIQPCPQAEEVESEKLRIEEVDGSEAIKEHAIHGESELKEIHEVSAEDDVLEKVENSGTNSSDYLEAADPSEETERVKADIQEPIMEIEASGTKALEEEKTRDDKAFKESSSNESLETITIQHCPQAEEVGSEKLRIEEVDGSEAIKEQAIHGGSELKEIHEVSAEDDILEKVENSRTKSSDYLEAADPSEQTETVKGDIQEPIMETEASGTKALEEEKTQDAKAFKESSSNESLETITIQHCRQAEEVGSEKLRIEEVDGSEAIKEQAIHGESEFKEIHEVSAEDDMLEKVENSGTKSSNYLEAADPSEQTERVKADIQEPIMETEASGTKALEEEKTRDDKAFKESSSNESLETVTIQHCPQAEEVGSEKLRIEEVDGSEAIKEQAIHGGSELEEINEVSAEDDILEKVENSGTNSSDYLEAADPREQTEKVKADIQEPIMETEAFGTKALEEEKTQDDKAFKESGSNESLETVTIQHCPQAEEVGSEKLQIEEVDGSEAIKEQAIHGGSELKQIHEVSAEDDILEKVENSGTKSSDYLEAADPSEQTETVKGDIQEPIMETEASGTKALEEEKTQDDKAFKESSSNESLETVTIQHCPQAEEVGSENLQIEEVDGSEAIKEQAIRGESELKEIHDVSAEHDIVEKVENSRTKSSDYLEAADPSEQTETVKGDIQEPIMETEASGTKALEEEKTQDAKAFKESSSNESLETITIQHCRQAEEVGSEKLRIEEVDGSEAIKEQAIHGESEFKEIHEVSAEDDMLEKVENSGTKSSNYLEAADPSEQTERVKADIQEPIMETEASGTKALEEEKTRDDKAFKESSSNESLETVTIQHCPQAEEVGNEKLRIEEVDGSEAIKEQAIHGGSELEEINEVSAEDDILEKVENSGTNSSDYLEAADPREQTEKVKADIQEPIMETEAFGTKALEEEKTQDDKAFKESGSNESLETVTIQHCPQAEEVGSEKLQIEEVDGSEAIKEQAIHGGSELKQIHEVSAEDDILEKVENSGTKSSDYLEAADPSEQTETVKGDIQEPIMEAEASGTKALEEEKTQDDKAFKESSSNESLETVTIQHCPQAEEVGSENLQIEEVDGSEAIKEQTIHGESELKEIHDVSAEHDIVEKVENSRTKSSDYLEAADPSEQTETLEESILETKTSGTKTLEEEKSLDEISLKPADVSTREAEDAEEKIKENMEVEADNFLGENDNATAVQAESIIQEAHMDDKAFKESNSNESLETITILSCPQVEEVGSEKLRIEEVDGSDAIKEQAIHGQSEFKEIPKEENSGTKSSDYIEAADPSEQTETVKADIQEPIMESEASGTKAPEEEKTQDDKAFKESSSNESLETVIIQHCPPAEEVGSEKLQIEEVDGSEAIKEQATHGRSELKEIHDVSTEDDILEKVENSRTKSSDYLEAADPSEQTEIVKADIQEPIMEIEASGTKALEEEKTRDDKAFKESSSNESLETVTIQHCPQAEEVDGSEAIKEQAIHGKSELKEIPEVSAEDDILEKVENSKTKSSDYLEAADPSEQTETVKADIQEPIMDTEASGTKALEEEKTLDEVSLKPTDVSTREAEDAEEKIKENMEVEADNYLGENDNATAIPAESIIQEALTDDKAFKESSSNESLETITIQPCPQAEEVDGSEAIKEQAIHGQSEFKEIPKLSTEDDILKKVKESRTKFSDYLDETDPSEQTETAKADMQEPTMETKAAGTKALEERNRQDKVSLKPADVSTRKADDAEEKIKENMEVEADNFLGENDNATAVAAESLVGEAHMEDKAVKEISSEEGLETIKIENIRLEQEEPMENVEKESVTLEKPGADKVKDDKTIPKVVIRSKYLGVEQTDETGQSLRVEKQDSDGTEEGIIEDSGTMSKAKSLGIEMVTKGEVSASQTLPAGNLEEEFQTPYSALVSSEQEYGLRTIVKEGEAIEIMEEEIIVDKNIDNSLETKATEETCLQKKEQLQALSSALLSEEQEHDVQTAFKKTEEESKKEVEMLDDKNINNFSAIKETEETGLRQEEPIDHEHEEKESATLEKQDTDEVEISKTVSDVDSRSKYFGVEETHEIGKSLKVEKLDSEGNGEGIKKSSVTVFKSESLGTEMVTKDEMTPDQTLPAENLEEHFQIESSEMHSLAQEHGPTIAVKDTEAIQTTEVEMPFDETCLQKEEQLQTLSSTLLSGEQENRATTVFKKIAEDSTKEMEMLGDKNINDLAIKATENTNLDQEVHRELKISTLGLEVNKEVQKDSLNKSHEEVDCKLDGFSKFETEEIEERTYPHIVSESEKTRELTRPIEEASNLHFEISEKSIESALNVHRQEVLIKSEEKIQDEGIVKLVDVPITVAEKSFETIEEEIKVEADNSCDKTEYATVNVETESSSGEDALNNMSTKDTSSVERRLETVKTESSTLDKEVDSMNLEKTSINFPAQLQKIVDKNSEKVSKSLKITDANEVEEIKTASGAVFESIYQTDETGQRLTVEKLDAAEIKETEGTSETSSNSKALGVEADSKHEVIADQSLPAGKLGEQLQTLSFSFLSKEQEHVITTAAERTEEKEMKEAKMKGDKSINNSSAAKATEGACLKMNEHMELEVSTLELESSKATQRGSSNEVQKEEGSKLDQASNLEPNEKEEMKYDDPPSEVQSHQGPPKSKDMKEKYLEAAMTDLNAEENHCKETVGDNQIFKNQVSIEEVREVVEEKEVVKDSQSVSPGDETIIQSHQEDELKAEECPEEETNKTFKATTNANQHEALKLPGLIDKDSASENNEKKIATEESYLDETEGKNIKEAVSELDLDYKSGETNITKEKTKLIALGEKEAGVEISQKEGTTGFTEVNEITEDIQQLEKTSYAASEIKIPEEADSSENKETAFITDIEDVLPETQHPSDRALQKVKIEHKRPEKATEIDAEKRGVKCEGEERIGGSGEIKKESASVDSAKMSVSDLMQGSMKKSLQEAENLTKESEPMPSRAGIQNEEAESNQIDKTRADEEEGDEQKRSEPDSDAPVMVEASKDADAKVPHKKSHNILSGVGSKVKRSISKVKKAITGKSSHPKTSPK